jgi:hypothetical protein
MQGGWFLRSALKEVLIICMPTVLFLLFCQHERGSQIRVLSPCIFLKANQDYGAYICSAYSPPKKQNRRIFSDTRLFLSLFMMMNLFWRWFVCFVVSLILQYTCSLQCSPYTHTAPVEQIKNKVVRDWEASANFLSLSDSKEHAYI